MFINGDAFILHYPGVIVKPCLYISVAFVYNGGEGYQL